MGEDDDEERQPTAAEAGNLGGHRLGRGLGAA